QRYWRSIRFARPEDARDRLGQQLGVLREVAICAGFFRHDVDHVSQEIEIREIGVILPFDPTAAIALMHRAPLGIRPRHKVLEGVAIRPELLKQDKNRYTDNEETRSDP